MPGEDGLAVNMDVELGLAKAAAFAAGEDAEDGHGRKV
jgi:hypothetical protein